MRYELRYKTWLAPDLIRSLVIASIGILIWSFAIGTFATCGSSDKTPTKLCHVPQWPTWPVAIWWFNERISDTNTQTWGKRQLAPTQASLLAASTSLRIEAQTNSQVGGSRLQLVGQTNCDNLPHQATRAKKRTSERIWDDNRGGSFAARFTNWPAKRARRQIGLTLSDVAVGLQLLASPNHKSPARLFTTNHVWPLCLPTRYIQLVMWLAKRLTEHNYDPQQ